MKALFRLVCSSMAVVSISCTSSTMVSDSGHYVIPFRLIGVGIPIIKVTLNDKDAWFIVDTGASASLVNMAVASDFGIPDFKNFYVENMQINGLGGRRAFESVSCRIGLGPLHLRKELLKSKDLNGLFDAIRVAESLTIAGILGSDVLLRYRMVLDYESGTISYRLTNGMRQVLARAALSQ